MASRIAPTPGSDPANADREPHLRSLLREHGLRCTAPRLAVLAVLDAQTVAGHLSAAQIHQRLLEQGREVDVTTVYRTVSTLVEIGILHTLTVDDRATYGLADTPHHHAVCTRCGRLIEVPAAHVSTAAVQAGLGSQFTLSERTALTIHGRCADCQREA
ncbi:Fur family transcriptional regulator [Nocardia altamirensis]|uniref:Fur family transcriptional regulator n=1 Tax=Nocardia altamirensis TaxID=472158 RepID=UPI0008408097|nr:Fur family transcriptional regulator [Nocardia altamirensis]